MKIEEIAKKEITDFEKEIGYELVVKQRSPLTEHEKYYVSFETGEIMKGGCLISNTGNGNTIDEALLDYCKHISYKRMAFGAYTNNRVEIDIPQLIHTKLLNK